MLNTRQKIFLAKCASTLVIGARKLLGQGPETVVTRKGIRYAVDLREGFDFSIYLLGAVEPTMQKVQKRILKKGFTVIDIGANVGSHTLHFAKSVGPEGRVYAIEPSDWAFQKMLKNFDLNADLAKNILAHQYFLTASSGEPVASSVYASWPLMESQDLHEKHGGRLTSTKNAQSITLDDFVRVQKIQKIDFIKIDVDGYDLAVIQGAGQTIARDHPVMIVEFAPYLYSETDFAEFVHLLKQAGYQFKDPVTGEPYPEDAKSIRKRIPDGASENVLMT